MTKTKSKKVGKYEFPEELLIQDSEKFKKDLLKLISGSFTSHELVLEKCEKLALATLQIFVAYVHEAKSKGIDIAINGPLHPNLSQQLEDLDLLKINGRQAILFNQLEEGGITIEY